MSYTTLNCLLIVFLLVGAEVNGQIQPPLQTLAQVTPATRVTPVTEAARSVVVAATESSPRRWQTSPCGVALVQGDDIIWRFNYETTSNTPYFHPVSTIQGQVLTWDRPPDHDWHHGLWFCWKFINGVNYWEHSRPSGKPDGRTEWSDLRIVTNNDSSASIDMALNYHPADDPNVVLVERRHVDISSPEPDGSYRFDWASNFTAIADKVTLDRVPPMEQSWGGYAGLSVRFAKDLTQRIAIRTDGQADFDAGDRHRSSSTAMDYSGLIQETAAGIAFLDHPSNPRHPTPWYAIRSPEMSYINAALLANEPLVLLKDQTLSLRYRLIVHPDRWTADRLEAAYRQFADSADSPESP